MRYDSCNFLLQLAAGHFLCSQTLGKLVPAKYRIDAKIRQVLHRYKKLLASNADTTRSTVTYELLGR